MNGSLHSFPLIIFHLYLVKFIRAQISKFKDLSQKIMDSVPIWCRAISSTLWPSVWRGDRILHKANKAKESGARWGIGSVSSAINAWGPRLSHAGRSVENCNPSHFMGFDRWDYYKRVDIKFNHGSRNNK